MEDQSLEYKSIWKDQYLCQICSFANSSGGRLLVGVRDDGAPVGLREKEIERLLADIPSKIKSSLDVVANVKLVEIEGVPVIEINVEQSHYPVNYNGEYYLRLGNTTQKLHGRQLTDFLNKKSGLLWDAQPVFDIPVSKFDSLSFEIFKREALRKQRLDKADLDISNEELLDHLNLLVDGKPKRAAVMLFYNQPGRLVVGSYLKIGKFDAKGELLYQDVLEGSLMRIADRALELIYTKYLVAKITYEKDVRVETYPYPREAVREALYNAICHNRYADSIPIQVRVNHDSLVVYNNGRLPYDWTTETLMREHPSRPYNPSIANAFYRAGYIENWGRGIKKICEQCREHGIPNPEFSALGDSLIVRFVNVDAESTSDSSTSGASTSGASTSGTSTSGKSTSGRETTAEPKKSDPVVLLKELRKHDYISQKELAKVLGISYSSVQRTLYGLAEQGVVTRIGNKRSAKWEINEQNYARIFGKDE